MNAPTIEDALDLPVTFDLPTAGRYFLLGRDASYEAERRGDFPCEVIRVGRRLIVTRAALLRALGISEQPQNANGARAPDPSATHTEIPTATKRPEYSYDSTTRPASARDDEPDRAARTGQDHASASQARQGRYRGPQAAGPR